MYTSSNVYIPDYRRVELTRFRVGSHRLRVETGRWSRTVRELRTCSCDGIEVQDEEHVVFKCDYTRELRIKHGIEETKTLDEILGDFNCIDFIYGVMKLFT